MPPPDTDLQLVLFLCYLTDFGLSALLVWSGRPFSGAWLWVGGQGLMALGTLCDALAPGAPPWVAQVLGNTAYVASSLLFIHSVWRFRFPRPFPRALYLLVPVQLLSFHLAFAGPYWVQALTFSVWMSAGSLATGVFLVWKVARPYRLSHGMTALPFFCLGLASLSRIVLVTALSQDLNSLGGLNAGYVSGAVLLGTVILFGYFAMTRTREEQALQEKDAEIEARNRRLVESGRSKDLFFSIIAHDLRGPIGGAARYVRKHLLGKMTGLESKYTEVETLAAALDKTNEFLEKLLWWSRAQLQDWAPAMAPVDLARVFDQSLSLVRSSADLKEIALEVDPAPYPRPWADPESIQLILGNLLSNAVKFSLPGRRIRIRVSEEKGSCRIVVEDEGVGMDQSTLDRLFRIEDKLTTHGTSGERGSGLGLLLARSLAERNGGGIAIESQLGVGTRASLWLPTEPSAQTD